MNPSGGPATPIYVVQPSEYRENGGAYNTDGTIAIPVYGYSATPTDRAVMGGPLIPVRVISDSDLVQNGGRYRLVGRPTALPVYAPSSTSRAIMGGPAMPVYAINSIPPVPTPTPTGLFLDQFTTNAVAPLATPRTAEPGPGHWALVQTDGNLSISGSQLVFPTQATPVMGDQGGYSVETFARLAGRAFMADYLRNSAASGTSTIGWFTSAGLGFANIESRLLSFTGGGSPLLSGINSAGQAPGLTLSPFAASVSYQIAVILRVAGGVFLLIKGGAYTGWTLVLYDEQVANTNLRIGFSNINGTGTIDNARIVDLPAPWTDDYGIVTSRSIVVASGDTATMTANGWAHVDWVAAAGETMELSVRRTTDNDRWIHRCIKNSNVIRIIEVVAGVETQRDSDANTWTTGTTYRVKALCDGTSMSNFVRAGTSDSSRNTYASATTNQSATGVKVAGGASLANLETYPRDVNSLVPVGV